MVRRKDPFWMYVEDLGNGRFSCNFCKRDFAGGISRIKSHLSGLQGHDIQICLQVPVEVKLGAQAAIKAIDTPTKRAKYVAASNSIIQGENISGSSSSHMPNLSGSSSSNTVLQDKRILDEKLVRFIRSVGLSFDDIESPLFKDFVNGVAEHGPGYEVPRSYVAFHLGVSTFEKAVREYVGNVIKYSFKTGCTLMFNKLPQEKLFVDIFAYTPIGVACMDLSSMNISKEVLCFKKTMSSIMEIIGPKNVVQLIINDGDGDHRDDVSSTCRKYPWIYRTPCATRGIKLLLMKIYDVPFVYNTIQVAQGIGTYIYNNKVNVEDLGNGRFSCNFCKQDFAGGISRIKSHLSGLKGRDIQICSQVPEAVKLQAIDVIDTPTKRAKYVAASNTVLQGEHISGSSSSHMPNLCKGHHKNILDKQLATFLSLEGISFHALQSPFFKAFVNGIAEYGPGYQVPSSIGIKKHADIVAREVGKYVEEIKDYSVMTGCTLMYNKSSRQQSFLDIFVYTPIGVACMDVFHLDSFNNIFFTWKIHPKNVVQLIINDGEGDLEYKASSICRKYPWIYRTPCATRGIELLLRKIYLVPFVYNTIQVARCIGTYIYKNVVNVPYLTKKVNGRFRRGQRREDAIASSFFMLTSLLEVENELQDLREQLELRVSIETVASSTLIEKFHRRAIFTVYVIRCKEFWSRAKIVAQVMRPIFQALCLVRFEGPTSGYLYEMMESVKDALEQCRDSYHVLYDVIRNILDEVRSNIIDPIHAAAAFLNPMYMCSEKFKENEEMKNGVKHIWDHLVVAEEKEAFMKQVQLYRMKDSNVFTAEAMIKLKTSHPRIWWEHCGNHISVLQKYAIRILSQPCSSSLCKQYKSLHKDFYQHAFKMNAILMERYESLKAQIIEPIILDKLEVSDEVNYQHLFKDESEDESEDESDDESIDHFEDEDYLDSFIDSDIFEEDVYLVDWSHRYADNIIKDPTGSWLDWWPRK